MGLQNVQIQSMQWIAGVGIARANCSAQTKSVNAALNLVLHPVPQAVIGTQQQMAPKHQDTCSQELENIIGICAKYVTIPSSDLLFTCGKVTNAVKADVRTAPTVIDAKIKTVIIALI